MAMKLGYKTKQLIIGGTKNVRLSNETYDDLIDVNTGLPKGIVHSSDTDSSGHIIEESEYLDLGIVTDEGVDLSAGGIALSVPTGGADKRYNWNIGGRVLRVTITGIIPDGTYYAKTSDNLGDILNGKSNASVFLYKINKYFAYTSLFTKDAKAKPNTCQYRRYYIDEKAYRNTSDYNDDWDYTHASEIGSFVLTNYHTAFIKGTRHLQYTLTLDFSNDAGDLSYDATNPNSESYVEGIFPRLEGDL